MVSNLSKLHDFPFNLKDLSTEDLKFLETHRQFGSVAFSYPKTFVDLTRCEGISKCYKLFRRNEKLFQSMLSQELMVDILSKFSNIRQIVFATEIGSRSVWVVFNCYHKFSYLGIDPPVCTELRKSGEELVKFRELINKQINLLIKRKIVKQLHEEGEMRQLSIQESDLLRRFEKGISLDMRVQLDDEGKTRQLSTEEIILLQRLEKLRVSEDKLRSCEEEMASQSFFESMQRIEKLISSEEENLRLLEERKLLLKEDPKLRKIECEIVDLYQEREKLIQEQKSLLRRFEVARLSEETQLRICEEEVIKLQRITEKIASKEEQFRLLEEETTRPLSSEEIELLQQLEERRLKEEQLQLSKDELLQEQLLSQNEIELQKTKKDILILLDKEFQFRKQQILLCEIEFELQSHKTLSPEELIKALSQILEEKILKLTRTQLRLQEQEEVLNRQILSWITKDPLKMFESDVVRFKEQLSQLRRTQLRLQKDEELFRKMSLCKTPIKDQIQELEEKIKILNMSRYVSQEKAFELSDFFTPKTLEKRQEEKKHLSYDEKELNLLFKKRTLRLDKICQLELYKKEVESRLEEQLQRAAKKTLSLRVKMFKSMQFRSIIEEQQLQIEEKEIELIKKEIETRRFNGEEIRKLIEEIIQRVTVSA